MPQPPECIRGPYCERSVFWREEPGGKGRCAQHHTKSEGKEAWSQQDIVYFLETGSDPDFDVIGESILPVQENMARLPARDREAIAAFLKTLPARPD